VQIEPQAVQSAPTLLVSEYGDLLALRPVNVPKVLPEKQALKKVKMVGSNQNAKDLLRQMIKNPDTYFLFDPKGHFVNSRTTYKSLKKLLDEKYFGNLNKAQKKKLDEKYGADDQVIGEKNNKETREALKNIEKKQNKTIKGTLFQKC